MKLVTIHRSFNPAEADLIRSRLGEIQLDVNVQQAVFPWGACHRAGPVPFETGPGVVRG